jgi:hypothetical protein
VTATLSPPVRIAVVVGLLAATGLAAAFFLLGRAAPATEAEPAMAPAARPAPPTVAPATSRPTATATPRRATAMPTSGLPAPVGRALRHRRVVVVSVYVPGATVDRIVREEARAGATRAGAAFVAVPATSSTLLTPLLAKAGGVFPSPAVLVVRRPGTVAATFGVTDRDVVAQAALEARR